MSVPPEAKPVPESEREDADTLGDADAAGNRSDAVAWAFFAPTVATLIVACVSVIPSIRPLLGVLESLRAELPKITQLTVQLGEGGWVLLFVALLLAPLLTLCLAESARLKLIVAVTCGVASTLALCCCITGVLLPVLELQKQLS